MKRLTKFLPVLILLPLLSACAPVYRGKLVDVRNYLNLNADGHSPAQQYSAYYAMRANLPAGIASKKHKLILLGHSSSQLAKYSSLEVKAKGRYLAQHNLLKISRFWVKADGSWTEISIR